MQDKSILFFFVFFVFAIFLMSNTNISGQAVDSSAFDVSNRFCRDSDGGIRAFTAGYVKSDIGTFNDKCQDNLNQIREYSCGEGPHGGRYKVMNVVINCGSGFVCERDLVENADACVRS